jgi:hypothetical protein
MDRDGIARRKSLIERLIETRIERFCVLGILCHGVFAGAALILMGFC